MCVWVGLFVWFLFVFFYLGSVFFSDFVIGVLVGVLVVWYIICFDLKLGVNVESLFCFKLVWWGLIVVCVIFVIIWL